MVPLLVVSSTNLRYDDQLGYIVTRLTWPIPVERTTTLYPFQSGVSIAASAGLVLVAGRGFPP
jgi:hypothetical protein